MDRETNVSEREKETIEREEEEETLPIFIPSDGFKELKSDSSFLDMNVSVPAALSFLSSRLLRVQLFGPTPGRGNTNRKVLQTLRGVSSSAPLRPAGLQMLLLLSPHPQQLRDISPSQPLPQSEENVLHVS